MIVTDRLVLRPWKDADRLAFAAINGDPRVHDWLGGPIPPAVTDAMVDRINAAIAANGFGFWAAEHRADGRLAGMIGLSRVGEGDLPVGPCVEIGWRLHPDFLGLGLASEGAKAALDWGFGSGGLWVFSRPGGGGRGRRRGGARGRAPPRSPGWPGPLRGAARLGP